MALTQAPEELLDRSFTTALTISTADNSSQLILTSTDADSSEGPVLELYRNSSSPADSDVGGQIEFHAENDADEKIAYAKIRIKTADVSDGTEDGTLAIQTITAGSNRNRFNIQAAETVINEDSRDLDFRVESNGNANMLFVNGGSDKVLIGHTAARNVGYSDSAVFRIEGTSYPNASIATVLNSNNANGPSVVLGKSRGTSVGSNTVVQDNDNLGVIDFVGSDGTDMAHAGVRLSAAVDGTPGSNDMPGRFVISTTADGASSPTERIRINSNGLTFNGDTAAANALDDYEEGDWTPQIIAGTTNPTGGANLDSRGSYIKIGRQVFINFYIGVSWTNSPSGGIYIQGLPFTIANDNDNNYGFPVTTYNFAVGNAETPFLLLQPNTQTLLLYMMGSGAWGAGNFATHTSSPLYITGHCHYFV